jgi:hypothetical protein
VGGLFTHADDRVRLVRHFADAGGRGWPLCCLLGCLSLVSDVAVKMGIVTSSRRELVAAKLGDLARFFPDDCIVCDGDT